MGQMIIFLTARNKKPLAEVFTDHYNDFHAWCMEKTEFSDAISPEAQDFLLDHRQLPDLREMDPLVLNDLVVYFVNLYYGVYHQDIFEDRNPTMKRERYEDAIPEIEKRCSEQVVTLWNYLTNGRNVWDGNGPAVSHDLYHRVGYWTVAEQQQLLEALRAFPSQEGNFEAIKFVLQVLKEIAHEKVELVILTA